jgi:hypothetical protein
MYLTLEKGCGGRMIGQRVYVKLMSQSERVQISVYLPKEVHEALVKWAEEEDRSVSNLVVRVIGKALDDRQQ